MGREVLVMVSGTGSNLEKIIQYAEYSKHYKVVGVITDKPDCNAIQIAIRYSIKVGAIINIPRLFTKTTIETIEHMINYKNDVIVVLAGYMKILPKDFIEHFSVFNVPIINIHPSLLPKYKGLDTHKRVIENKEKEHGITIHYVNEFMDDGEIIFQEKVKVNEKDTEETLKERIQCLEHANYPIILSKCFDNIRRHI